MANVIREDVVKLSFDVDTKGLDSINKEMEKIKKSLFGIKGDDAMNDIDNEAKKTKKSVKGVNDVFEKINDTVKKTTKSIKSTTKTFKDFASTKLTKLTKGLQTVKNKLGEGVTKAKTLATKLISVSKISLSKLNSQINTLTKKIGSGLVSAAKKAATAIAAIGAGLIAGATAGVKYNSQIETYQTSFEVMTGSAKEAVRITEELQKMGAETPFEMTDLADTTQLLMNYGLSADDAISRMSMLGDISQGSADKMNRIAMAYGQMSSAGKVSLEDVKQMIEAGFNPLQEISKTTGESMASLYDRISDGKISVDEITQSMIRSTSKGGKYFESMQKQSKTLSGQLSTLKDNAQQFLGTLTSGITEKIADDVLPKLNKTLSAWSDAFKEGGVSALLKEFGSLGKAIQRIIDKVKEVGKNTKKMQKIKKVFDKIKQVLNTVVDLAGDLVEHFIDFMTAESTLSAIEGILDAINKALKWCKKNWELVETAIVGVVGVIAGLKLANFINDLTKALAKAELLKTKLTGMQKLTLAVGVTLAITGIVMEGKGIADSLTEGLNLNNAGEIAGGATSLVAGGALIGKTFGKAVMGGAIAAIPAGIAAFFAGIWDSVKNGISWLSAALTAGGAALAGAGIGALIGSVGGPLGALIGLCVGLVVDLVILIVQKWDEICAWTSKACKAVGQFFVDLWNGIKNVWNSVAGWFNSKVIQPVVGFFTDLWNGIKGIWNGVSNWFNTKIIQPVVGFFRNLGSGIANGFNTAITTVKTAFTNLWNWFISTPIVQWFSQLFTSIFNTIKSIVTVIIQLVQGCWTIIKAVWGVVAQWFNTAVIQPVANFFRGLWNGIKNAALVVCSAIKSAWGSVTNFFKGLWDGIKNLASSAWEGIVGVWNTCSTWFKTTIIQPVADAFSSLWNGIKNAGSKAWNLLKIGALNAWNGIKSIFSKVGDFFGSIFSNAWQKVKNVFSVGGKIFAGIKDGIVEAFKKVVNAIIKGINKVVAIPFNAINKTLSWLRGLDILGVQPFTNIGSISVPEIPLLANGGLLTKPTLNVAGEAGPEMVIPLSNNKRKRGLDLWLKAGKALGVNQFANGGLTGKTSHTNTGGNNTVSFNGNIFFTDNVEALWADIIKQFDNGGKNLETITNSFVDKIAMSLSQFVEDTIGLIAELPINMGKALEQSGGSLSDSLVEIWKDAVKASAAPVNKLLDAANWILKEFGSEKRVISWTPYAKGTGGHKGGNALVNDGRGAELVQMPNGRMFIPNGRNVFLPNAPKGMKVLPAERTAQLLGRRSPTFRYADGVGNLDLWSHYDNSKGLVRKITKDISYEGMSRLASNIGRGMVSTFAGAMPAWVDKLFEENGQSLASYVASKGVTQWMPTVIRALKMEGQYSAANVKRTLFQMRTESGGNPRAINLWDSNAKKGIPSKGLMQVIDPTFKAYAKSGYNKNIYDPLSNILASVRYAVSRYGSLSKAYRGVGYSKGVGTISLPSQSSSMSVSYTPESDARYYSSTTVEYNTYSPQFTLTIEGASDDRVLARKVKRWVSEAMEEAFSSLERKSSRLQEV